MAQHKKTKQPKSAKSVTTLKHEEAKRKNIPTAEHQSVMDKQSKIPVKVRYSRDAGGLEDEKETRNRDLDLQRESKEREHEQGQITPDRFSDFNCERKIDGESK